MRPFERHVLATFGGCEVVDVGCLRERSSWTATDTATAFGVVFVRRGCFRRRVGIHEEVAHPGVAYFEQPGREQEFSHPNDGEVHCTFISLSPELMQSIELPSRFPTEGVFVDTQTDLRHRRLLTACRAGVDLPNRETMVQFVNAVLRGFQKREVIAARPSTVEARRQIVEGAREALATDMTLTLIGLCRELATSPYHLSRIFREQTGRTVSAYRNSLRVRVALECLSQGAESLGRVASELGFSDHAHLTRVVRAETGMTPSQLRDVLYADASSALATRVPS